MPSGIVKLNNGDIMKYLVIERIKHTHANDSFYNHYTDGFDSLELANEYAQLQAKLNKYDDTTYTVVPFGDINDEN